MDVIKKTLCIVFVSLGFISFAQQDSTQVYKKKVLETLEIDLLLGYYEQEGTHASVTGGIGNEDLQNTAPSVVVRIPLNEDDVLTADVGMSAYTSASSSNGNPFNTAASSGSGAVASKSSVPSSKSSANNRSSDSRQANSAPIHKTPGAILDSNPVSAPTAKGTITITIKKNASPRPKPPPARTASRISRINNAFIRTPRRWNPLPRHYVQ